MRKWCLKSRSEVQSPWEDGGLRRVGGLAWSCVVWKLRSVCGRSVDVQVSLMFASCESYERSMLRLD